MTSRILQIGFKSIVAESELRVTNRHPGILNIISKPVAAI